MDISEKEPLRDAINRIRSALSIKANAKSLDQYLNGFRPELLNYDKLNPALTDVISIERYLICCESYLVQPDATKLYDIYRAARIIPIIRSLDIAIQHCIAKRVGNLMLRLERLARSPTFDQLDSAIFEIVCAGRYASLPEVSSVTFIPEDSQPRPDLAVTLNGKPLVVECKKVDRILDFAIGTRDRVQALIGPTISYLRKRNVSAIAEVNFKIDPSEINPREMHDAILLSLESGVAAIRKSFFLRAHRITPQPIDGCTLMPSPLFLSRYDYRPGQWQGIVHSCAAHFSAPGWVDRINWEFAAKWQVSDEKTLWKHRRLGYDLLYKGLCQLLQNGEAGILHVCYERDVAVGHRAKELHDFLSRLRPEMTAHLSWLVFTELISDVTPLGRFDFIEHTHPVSGPRQEGKRPPAEGIFTGPEGSLGIGPRSSFGIGPELPSLDL